MMSNKKESNSIWVNLQELGYNTEDVTRVEVIDENGRSYVNRSKNNNVKLSFQDEGRTLKIFISNQENDEEI